MAGVRSGCVSEIVPVYRGEQHTYTDSSITKIGADDYGKE